MSTNSAQLSCTTRIGLGLFASALLWAACVATSLAACPTTPAESALQIGEVGVFFDPEARVNCHEVPLDTDFTLYVVLRMPEGGMDAFLLPTGLMGWETVSTSRVEIAEGYELQPIMDYCDFAVVTTPENCEYAEGELVVLATLRARRLSDVDPFCPRSFMCPHFWGNGTITLQRGVCGSLIPGEDWIGIGVPMLAHGDLCLYFGDGIVSTSTMSWTMLKLGY